MKKQIFKTLTLLGLILTSCGTKEYPLTDYIYDLPYKDNFKLLVMGDIHLGNKDDLAYHFQTMDLTINDAQPDLLILNGDLFTFGDEETMRTFFDFIESHNIPWGVTYGNHDEQCFFTVDHMSRVASEYPHSVFKYVPDDNVYGYSNYCVNLKQGDATKFSIYMLDSNRYRYSPYIGYDYIHQDQIDWYEKLVQYNGGSATKSIAIYHIPVPEFETAYNLATEGSSEAQFVDYVDARGGHGELKESVSDAKQNSGFFAKEVALGSTIANVCSHDHVNDYAVKYQGVTLLYSVNSTGRIYGDKDKRGGTLITIKNGTDLELKRYFHVPEEVQ